MENIWKKWLATYSDWVHKFKKCNLMVYQFVYIMNNSLSERGSGIDSLW
jgi:hypothetical protein